MAAPLDSDLMRSFLAVADTGSVTSAAARLGRTQSAVSLQIKRLACRARWRLSTSVMKACR